MIYSEDIPEAKPNFDLVQQLLRRQLDGEELKLLNHIEGLAKLGIEPPYDPPLGMTQEWADKIAIDIETKLADIVHKLPSIRTKENTVEIAMIPENEING